MNDRTTYSAWMMSFLAGGLVGVSAGLLLAPQSGRASREAARNRLRDAADSARGLKQRAERRGGEIRDEAARRVGAAASALAGNGADEVVAD
jgi:gas vesicle protein